MKIVLMILAIGIVVFGVVMAGCEMSGGSTATLGCAATELEPLDSCHDDGAVYLNLMNKGINIDGLKIFLEASYNISITIDGALKQGSPVRKSLDFGNQGLDGFERITIRPIIKRGTIDEVCRDKAIKMEILPCTQ